MNPRKIELATSILYLCEEECGDNATAPSFYAPHLNRLTDEFYQWADRLEAAIVKANLGALSLDDLWPGRIELVYLCVRLGHGVGFNDHFRSESAEYKIGTLARQYAKEQPHIEDGAYLGDDGVIYLYNYHTASNV
jgi:hypothetical protein